MAAGSRDNFGDAGEVQPATAGSYGQPAEGFRLPEGTRLGPVHLQVRALDRSLAYYEQLLGLRLVERGDAHATLAAQADVHALVVLHEHPGAKPMRQRGRLGLYHFALLLPDRASLGQFVLHLASRNERAGSADHLVSEALYLQDPDGLGIEVYADRPRAEWSRTGRELMMASDPLDMQSLIDAAGGVAWTGMPVGTTIGHVHLHVGELDAGSRLFSSALGFDRMAWSYPGALFFGADGYHHHLGTNTWAGPTAAPPNADDARLLEWTIEVPNEQSVTAVAESVRNMGFDISSERGELVVKDPWGTALRIRVGIVPLRQAVPRAVTS